MEKAKLGVGLAHEIEIMGRKTGWTDTAYSRLATDEALNRRVLAVLFGQAEIVTPLHLIDCDAAPFVPQGWSVEEHVPGGQFAWDASEVQLYLDNGQTGSKYIKGNMLREALKGQRVLNANVLDYLLANPHLIPEEWKGKRIFFWGTIYRNDGDYSCVRCLSWSDGRLDCGWLGGDWGSGNLSAVLVS